jgi:hypothetical protein
MKKVEILSYTEDTTLYLYYPKDKLKIAIGAEEYEFLERHRQGPFEQVKRLNHDTFETTITYYVTLTEPDETFWRLKFK